MRLIVWSPLLPTAVENPLPLEGKRAEGGVVALTALALLLVIRFRPSTLGNGESGEFVKGLPHEFGCTPAPDDVTGGLAAAYSDGCDSRVLLDLVRGFEALALTAECCQEPGERRWRRRFPTRK